MRQKEIIVDIDEDGGVKMEANGYTGKACTDATRALELALGMAQTRSMKPEAFQVTQQKVTVGK